jgi:hypothetical protein
VAYRRPRPGRRGHHHNAAGHLLPRPLFPPECFPGLAAGGCPAIRLPPSRPGARCR